MIAKCVVQFGYVSLGLGFGLGLGQKCANCGYTILKLCRLINHIQHCHSLAGLVVGY